MPGNSLSWWIDRNEGHSIRLPSQNHAMKLLSQTPSGFFELFSIQERLNTDGGSLLIIPKLLPSIKSPYFDNIIQQQDIHISIYPNLNDPDYIKVHFSTHATEASIDFMARIKLNGGRLCTPIFGAIYGFPMVENVYRRKNKHLSHLVAKYRPERCSLTAWLVISQKEEAIAVPWGWATYRFEFHKFSLHFLFSYINCPSSPRTTFFPIFSNEMRLRVDSKEKFIPTIPPAFSFESTSPSAMADNNETISFGTMAGSIMLQMAFGSMHHFSKAADFFEERNLLIDNKPPREWFLMHCNDFQDEPFEGPTLVTLQPNAG